MNQILFNQCVHNGGTEAVDVHGVPADKVSNVPAELGGTLRTGAAQEGAIFILLDFCAAGGAHIRQMVRDGPFRALGEVHFQNFRDDLPCLANQHRVPYPDVPLGDEVLIMQRGVGDGGSRQAHGAYHRLGGQHAGAAHLDHDLLHHGGLDLRGVLIGRGPTGELCCGTQPLPLGKVVHLDHRAVNVADQLLPVFVDGIDLGVDFLGPGQAAVGNDLEFPLLQIVQRLTVAGEGDPVSQLNVENIDIQSPFCRDFRVQLAQRACGGVSGVGKERLALLLLAGVELLKAFLGHENLAPDDEPGRGVFNAHGDGTDGFQVFRHILANVAVTPGGTPDKLAVYVFQRHGQSVDFRLHGEAGASFAFQHPAEKTVQLFHAEHILKAHQRHRMGHFFKLTQGFAAHPFGGRIGFCQLRVGLFQVLQLPQQVVIFKILHLGVIQHVILVIRLGQDLGQFLNSMFRVHKFLRFVNMCSARRRRLLSRRPPLRCSR